MRRSIALATLALLILPCFIIGVHAVDNNMATWPKPDYVEPTDNGFYELKMELNCTWGIVTEFYDTALHPLPGTGWAYEIVRVEVPEDMVVYLYVSDFLAAGDRFEAWRIDGVAPTGGTLVGVTSLVPVNGTLGEGDIDIAFADPRFSHGVFALELSAGKYYFAFREFIHYYSAASFGVKFCPGPIVGGTIMPTNMMIVPLGLVAVFAVALSAVALPRMRKSR